ncbi:MAG: hypothetical protein QHC78_12365 [Pigmentiphaga sp.]|uniref:hypothetical protein n=1 Tax=Pigmentiphaga sp. TaxID=1977564 RepID=UPI0029A154B5|nr:hypothetical protein [Pigmentiphaga sp.]MDX3906474.1 hypothetical protein [Pigmentiphaga sp.]
MTQILMRLATVRAFPSPREFVFRPWSLFRRRYDYVFLNWVESLAFAGPNGDISLARLALLRLYLFACRVVSTKLVWVRHNNHPHHVKTENGKATAKALLDHIESTADIVITHSPLEVNGGKRFYVPHPLYANDIAPTNPVPYKDYFFVFGHIAPYKKLEEAIRLLPDQVSLVIAGPVKDKAYFEKCQSLAANKSNVLLMPGFLDSPTAARIASDSHGLLVLNADTDMVVSGSYIYALSLSIPVFAVRTPFIQWLSADERLSGIHAFDNISTLISALSSPTLLSNRPDRKAVESLFGDEITLEKLKLAMGISSSTR